MDGCSSAAKFRRVGGGSTICRVGGGGGVSAAACMSEDRSPDSVAAA